MNFFFFFNIERIHCYFLDISSHWETHLTYPSNIYLAPTVHWEARLLWLLQQAHQTSGGNWGHYNEEGLLPSNLALGCKKICFHGKKTAKLVKKKKYKTKELGLKLPPSMPMKAFLRVRPCSQVILKITSVGHLGIPDHCLYGIAKILFLCKLPKKCHI